MAVLKLSQIANSGSNFTSGDFLVAVQGGTTDVLFSLAQAQFGIIGGISGTTVTTNAPVINLAQTWNAGGVAFTGLQFNITNTASAAGSLLMDFQIASSSVFTVNKFSGVFVPNNGSGSAGYWFSAPTQFPTLGLYSSSNNVIFTANGNDLVSVSYFSSLTPGTGGLVVRSASVLGFSPAAVPAAPDAYFTRDAAGIIAQNNSTNAQTFRVYNTFTDTSNYERGVFDWGTTSNVLTIDVQVLGTGTQRVISIKHLDSATGAGTATFAATNCPATTLTSPYTWVKVTSSDGSIVYMPAWK